MRFATLASGSAGNATLVQHDATVILIDCGLSVRQVEQRAATLGIEIADLDAILLTHEHDDHVAGAAALARRCGAPVYSTVGTRAAASTRLDGMPQLVTFAPGQRLNICAFQVAPVIVPHDAREPCQFVITGGGKRLGLLTDLGQPTAHLAREYADLDGLMLEFNHDVRMLADSVYPRTLKLRIGGEYGHLSNPQAVALLKQIDSPSMRCVVAAHLSEKTNSPERVEALLDSVLPNRLERYIATQGCASPWFELD